MTIELQVMDEREARRVTERIRIAAHNYSEARTKLMERVQEAKDGNAHIALDYASWQAYLAEVLGEEPMRLARDERQDMVKMLANEGMSTRAIAPIVGANFATVSRDLQATVAFATVDEPRVSHGLDGKTRTHQPRPDLTDDPEPVEPPKPKRRPITDQARDAGWEIRKATERIERILSDDRFSRNKDEMATSMRGHLEYVIESCQGFLDQINN